MIGDVIGHHQALRRTVLMLDESGQLPTADWDSLAPLGPGLEVVVERLRAHIRKSIDGFDASRPVQERASYLQKAVEDNRLGESLELLVIAEDSLYLWQRLRIERVKHTEPEHLELVVASARKMLADHLAADGELLLRGRLNSRGTPRSSRSRSCDGCRMHSSNEMSFSCAKISTRLRRPAEAKCKVGRTMKIPPSATRSRNSVHASSLWVRPHSNWEAVVSMRGRPASGSSGNVSPELQKHERRRSVTQVHATELGMIGPVGVDAPMNPRPTGCIPNMRRNDGE